MWQLTAKDRLARTLKAINRQCRLMRPWPLAEQHQRLCRMLKGHMAYFGISGNIKRLGTVIYQSRRLWHKWLSRRSWRSSLTWEKFARLLTRYPMPTPRIIHPFARS